MKKTYMIPSNKVVELGLESCVLNPVSGGVGDGATLLNEYDENDVSYAKEQKSLWDELW